MLIAHTSLIALPENRLQRTSSFFVVNKWKIGLPHVDFLSFSTHADVRTQIFACVLKGRESARGPQSKQVADSILT